MKKTLLLLVGLGLGFAAYKNITKEPPKPPPPPPEPPPIIIAPPKPAPILTQDEMRRIGDATQDQDENVRWEAARFLIKLDHPDTDQVLFRMLSKDASVNLRVRVAELLASPHEVPGHENKRPQITEALAGALRDTEAAVRAAALRSLAKVGDYSAASPITDLLKDMDQDVRLEAVRTLNILQERKNEDVKRETERLQEEAKRKAEEAAKRRQQEMLEQPNKR